MSVFDLRIDTERLILRPPALEDQAFLFGALELATEQRASFDEALRVANAER